MNGLFITDQLQPCIWPHKHLIWAWKDWKQTTWSWNVLFSEKQPELIVTLIFRLPPPARITRTRWYHTVRATSIHIRTDLSQRPLALCRINQPPFTLCPPPTAGSSSRWLAREKNLSVPHFLPRIYWLKCLISKNSSRSFPVTHPPLNG